MASLLGIASTLRTAINSKNENLMWSTSQFYSNRQQRPITLYCIKKCIIEDGEKNRYVKLLETPSKLQVVLFLRDYWNLINGIELDTSNPEWEKRKKYIPFYINNNLVEEDEDFDEC